MSGLKKHAFLAEGAAAEEGQTDPGVLMERICVAMEGTQSSPSVLSTVFLRVGLSLAIQNKCDEATWGQLKRSIFTETNDSFDRLVKGFEAGRAGA